MNENNLNETRLRDLEKLIKESMKEKTSIEVADCFLDVPFDQARLAIRSYVETQPETFREQFDNYITSKMQENPENYPYLLSKMQENPLRNIKEEDYEFDCA